LCEYTSGAAHRPRDALRFERRQLDRVVEDRPGPVRVNQIHRAGGDDVLSSRRRTSRPDRPRSCGSRRRPGRIARRRHTRGTPRPAPAASRQTAAAASLIRNPSRS
jgi:hypothetical protein